MINVALFECNEKKAQNPAGFLKPYDKIHVMTEYQFENQKCTDCKKPRFCIRKDLDWLCQECFSWAVGFAEQKDVINEIMAEKLEDLELRNDRD